MIYLASPYTHDDPVVMHKRHEQVCLFAASMMKAGYFVYSPIAHSVALTTIGELPHEWAFWRDYDLHMLSLCKELHVLQLDGWKESIGVAAEIKYAESICVPIAFRNFKKPDGACVICGGVALHHGALST